MSSQSSPVRHTHTRLHTPLSNICSSPSSLQHTRGLIYHACLLPQPYPQCSVLKSGILVLHYRQGEPHIGRQYNSVETAQPGDRTTNPDIVMPECYASSQRVDSLAGVVITPVRHTHTRLHLVAIIFQQNPNIPEFRKIIYRISKVRPFDM